MTFNFNLLVVTIRHQLNSTAARYSWEQPLRHGFHQTFSQLYSVSFYTVCGDDPENRNTRDVRGWVSTNKDFVNGTRTWHSVAYKWYCTYSEYLLNGNNEALSPGENLYTSHYFLCQSSQMPKCIQKKEYILIFPLGLLLHFIFKQMVQKLATCLSER